MDEAAELLSHDDLSAKRLASDIIRAHFPPVAVSQVETTTMDLTPAESMTDDELRALCRDSEEDDQQQ